MRKIEQLLPRLPFVNASQEQLSVQTNVVWEDVTEIPLDTETAECLMRTDVTRQAQKKDECCFLTDSEPINKLEKKQQQQKAEQRSFVIINSPIKYIVLLRIKVSFS